MDPLAARVLRTIRRHDQLPPGSRVLAAVSGGSDSMALLYLLVDLQQSGGFEVAAVAHVHHGLRGAAADADAEFCRAAAAALSLPFHVERVDVRTRARREGRSLEDAARAERYEALARAAGALGADRTAVGHTSDDQAETVLLRLLRGSGGRGLGGILPTRGDVVRPLLEIGRDELRGWLGARGVAFVDDESNADLSRRRNAIRHAVMPVLQRHFGAAVPAVLARHADVAREDERALAEVVRPLADASIGASDSEVRVDWDRVREALPAVQRRVVRQALLDAGVREPGLDHVLGALEVARGDLQDADLPGGLHASLRGTHLVLTRGRTRHEDAPFSYELSVPGSVWIPEAGTTVGAERIDDAAQEVIRRLRDRRLSTAVLAADQLSTPLTVRSWRPGDVLRPLGLGGRKKVQDLFVDRKVPAAARGRVPLIVDGDGRIVWVTGHAIDEACRVTEATRAVVVLTMSESGGRG